MWDVCKALQINFLRYHTADLQQVYTYVYFCCIVVYLSAAFVLPQYSGVCPFSFRLVHNVVLIGVLLEIFFLFMLAVLQY